MNNKIIENIRFASFIILSLSVIILSAAFIIKG